MAIFELLAKNSFVPFTDNFSFRKHNHLVSMTSEASYINYFTKLQGLPPHLVFKLPELDYPIICGQKLECTSISILFRASIIEELHIVDFLFKLY
jgi:hypothetical protein